MRVYVILFNARTDNEGIHSLQSGDHNVIMMFTERDDAERYAIMLEAQDMPTPAVEEMDASEIEEFCASSNYECLLVEEGMLVVPPENNVTETDWQEDGTHRSPESNAGGTDDRPSEGIDYDQIRRQLEGLL
jgi:Protein of unknown function (DUF3110)